MTHNGHDHHKCMALFEKMSEYIDHELDDEARAQVDALKAEARAAEIAAAQAGIDQAQAQLDAIKAPARTADMAAAQAEIAAADLARLLDQRHSLVAEPDEPRDQHVAIERLADRDPVGRLAQDVAGGHPERQRRAWRHHDRRAFVRAGDRLAGENGDG